MNLSVLQHRVARLLTRPPELLYMLSRHWLLLLVCVAIGGFVRWFEVRSEPAVFEARAVLQVTPVTLSVAAGRASPIQLRRETESFLAAQAGLLLSDAVLRRVIQLKEARAAARPSPSPPRIEPEPAPAPSIARGIKDVKRKMVDLLQLEAPAMPGLAEERFLQRQVELFRATCQIETQAQRDGLVLKTYGPAPEALPGDLILWIDAYRSYSQELSRSVLEDYVEEQIVQHREIERAAWKELQDFREKNPEVSHAKHEDLGQEIGRLQTIRFDLRREIELGSLSTLSQDPEYNRLLTEKKNAEMMLLDKTSAGFTADSTQVKQLQAKIETLDERMKALRSGDELQKKQGLLEKITAELDGLWSQKTALEYKLHELDSLEERHKRAKESLEKLALLTEENIPAANTVQILVTDSPRAGTEPYNYRPLYKVGMGGAAGAAVGLALAFLLELFCGKVRFKHDIMDDYGLPVVAVFPRH